WPAPGRDVGVGFEGHPAAALRGQRHQEGDDAADHWRLAAWRRMVGITVKVDADLNAGPGPVVAQPQCKWRTGAVGSIPDLGIAAAGHAARVRDVSPDALLAAARGPGSRTWH